MVEKFVMGGIRRFFSLPEFQHQGAETRRQAVTPDYGGERLKETLQGAVIGENLP